MTEPSIRPFNLYDDPVVDDIVANPTKDESMDLILIEVDLHKDKSLFELIKPVRETLQTKSDDVPVTIYLVCGHEASKDAGLFIDYLTTIGNPVNIAFRGIIHLSFFKFLLLFPGSRVDSNCKVLYSKDQLHDVMSQLMIDPKIFRAFIQRFIDQYNNCSDGTFFDVTELELLGIDVSKF